MHYFAWFEGFGGEEAAAGAFDVGFANLDVHIFLFFLFCFACWLLWGRTGWSCRLDLGLVFLASICRVCFAGQVALHQYHSILFHSD